MPPSKKTIGFSELRVGLLVLGSIIVLIFLILNATGDINPFATKLHLRARLPNASGLREGSEVRLAGVTVGKVDNIQLLPPTDDPNAPKVEVRLAVNNKIDGQAATNRIRKDSTAQLDSPGLLGNEKIINVTPGTSIVEPVPENFLLPTSSAGGIPELTASGNELMGRLNKISDQVNGIVTKINNGEGSLGRAITDEALYNNLNSTIRETQDVIRQIRTGEGSAGKLLNDPALYNNANQIALQLSAISKDLQAGRGTAGKLLTDEALYNKANSTIDRLDQSINQINGLVGEVRAGRGTVGKLLTDEAIYNDARAAIARFNITAERIDNVVATAQRGEGTMGKLLTDDQLYSNVNQLSSESVKLLYDFRQNPKKYLTVKFQLF
jgi:phospholipid/cholesterol/gamma-HCH transport system substrate-binding protein